MSTNPDGPERRRYKRHETSLACELTIGGHTYTGKTKDVSVGGLLLLIDSEGTDTSWDLDDDAGRIKFEIPGHVIDLECEAIRISSNMVGLEFKNTRGLPEAKYLLEYLDSQLGALW